MKGREQIQTKCSFAPTILFMFTSMSPLLSSGQYRKFVYEQVRLLWVTQKHDRWWFAPPPQQEESFTPFFPSANYARYNYCSVSTVGFDFFMFDFAQVQLTFSKVLKTRSVHVFTLTYHEAGKYMFTAISVISAIGK